MANHTIILSHCNQFHDTSILAKKCGHMEHIIREVIETEPHPQNMNLEEYFSLSRSWKPLIQTLKKWN